MKRFAFVLSLVACLVLVSCGSSEPEYDFTNKDDVKAYTETYFADDSSVTVKSVSVNDDASNPGSLIMVLNMTFNNENDADLSKSASQAASDLFVQDIQDKATTLGTIVTNIEVPHLNGYGKIEYSRHDDKFAIDDIHYSF